MFQYLMFIMLIFNSFLFLNMNHPLSLGLILMLQTLLIALFTGNFTMMFWFSYSLFLIFMGGMLILFMYMTSLASNETFKFSLKFKMMNIILFFMFFVILLWKYDFKTLIFFNNNIINNENSSFISTLYLMEQNNLSLNKMYNFPNNMITILLINYLFLTLIMTVKITNIFKGPIRQKNY